MENIYYNGVEGAYGHSASLLTHKYLKIQQAKIFNIIGLKGFDAVWKTVMQKGIGVIPIENSFAGIVHSNLYNFSKYNCKIIGEITLTINHMLLSKELEINELSTIYSHPQALAQCAEFIKKLNLVQIEYSDTASAAQYISKNNVKGESCIASKLAGSIYGLNTLASNIQTQNGNKTKFYVIINNNNDSSNNENITKITILFSPKNQNKNLADIIKLLNIETTNITKIDRIPAYKKPFQSNYLIEISGSFDNQRLKEINKILNNKGDCQIIGKY